ncbi:MAG TPA: VanZ family protein [Candidatus Angelobacter sp.]|nr:VanZ family protein [Candidatus Angelobacter sp.]
MSSSALPKPSATLFRRTFLAWLPTALWLATIASFSTDLFSSAHTGQILMKIIHAIYGPISPHAFALLHAYIRKAAHFTVYGTLSGLAFYSWRASLPGRRRWTFKWSGLALALTLLAASLDEFHQSFVPSRTASPHDVLLDMMGAMFVQIVIATFTGESIQHPAK